VGEECYQSFVLEEPMPKKKKIPEKYQIWIDARNKFHLSHAQIQMAREIGLNPKKFGKLANHKQEMWKIPLPNYIEKLYFKHFGKTSPEIVKSIEQKLKDDNKKKEERKFKKAQKKWNLTNSLVHNANNQE
jgi:hypothetical protein